MTFTTITFAIFVALIFTIYWATSARRIQNVVLLVASYVFYGWWDYRFCFLMLASSLVDYVVGIALTKTQDVRWRRTALAVSMLCNLGLLGAFKYYDFFVNSLIQMAATVGFPLSISSLGLILPVGISFYTFQTMSYTIDIYRRRLTPTRDLVDYLAYVSFFPQLVAGPIERARRLLPQFQASRKFDAQRAADGCRQILWGFFKKLVIADRLAVIVDTVYTAPSEATGPQLMFATACFAFQIYADFSGYSDIAIGVGRLFGFDLMRNFALPYFSQTVGEFWRRWHISLSSWFRDYVYIPLGGSRRGHALSMFNVLLTFAISGFWHGASWTFVVWGLVNGAAILPSMTRSSPVRLGPSDTPGGESPLPRFGVLLRILRTFAFSCAAWVFFRANTIQDAMIVYRNVLRDVLILDSYRSVAALLGPSTVLALLMLGCSVALEWVYRRQRHPLENISLNRPARWLLYSALLWVSIFAQGPRGQFIYFQF